MRPTDWWWGWYWGREPERSGGGADLRPIGLGAALLGALGMFIAPFLPMADSKTFLNVTENTLIQHGGWPLLVVGGSVAFGAYRAFASHSAAWGVVVAGLIGVGLAIYYGSSDSLLTLAPATAPDPSSSLSDALENLSTSEKASPGIGIYIGGVGGVLAALGGFLLSRAGDQPAE